MKKRNSVEWTRLQRGPGPWSALHSTATTAAPPTPPQFVCVSQVDRSSATVLWMPPAKPQTGPQLCYKVDLQARSSYAKDHFGLTGVDQWLEVYKDAGQGCVFSDLQAGCQYAVRVQAISDAGPGIWCNPVDICTLPGMCSLLRPPF